MRWEKKGRDSRRCDISALCHSEENAISRMS